MARAARAGRAALLGAGATVDRHELPDRHRAAVAFAERLHGRRAVSFARQTQRRRGRADPTIDPAAFAAAVPRLLDRNVRLVGGCCGTTEPTWRPWPLPVLPATE